MRVAFVHPDLGLGGAERLVVDAALALQSTGHDCVVYTAHRDPARCFEDVAPGRERVPVRVLNPLFPRAILGRAQAILAALRCCVMALKVCLTTGCDVAFVDIVSLPVLIFAVFGIPVVFYCHFPDKVLAETLQRHAQTQLHRAYRKVVDGLEAVSLKRASAVVCNSRFTRYVYCDTFPELPPPDAVVYPCVRAVVPQPEKRPRATSERQGILVLSLNRYERKKNLPLAITAFANALAELKKKDIVVARTVKLVLAGGYDARLLENVEHYGELSSLVAAQDLSTVVELRRNISDSERNALLTSARVVLYTPEKEHLGIVPLEAMARGTAVIAANSGGPTETVVDGSTGRLVPASPSAFGDALVALLRDEALAGRMGRAGATRVATVFSEHALARTLDDVLERCGPKKKR